MKILTRYLLRQHAVPFVFALGALTGIMLLNQIAKRLPDLLGKGLPWSVIVEFFALSLPFIVAMTLAMAVLVAVLYTISRMSSDREITAMRAGGISLGRIMRPLLVAGVVTTLVAFLFGDQVLPRANHRLKNLMADIYRTKPTFSLKEHVINDVQPGRLALRAARIDQGSYRLGDVTVYDMSSQQNKRIVYADSGALAYASNQEDLYLTLYAGEIHQFDREDPRLFQVIDFAQQVIRVRGVGSEFVRRASDDYRGDREMGVCQLEDVVLNARRDGVIAARRATIAQTNGLRALVGLAPMEPDTAMPPIQRGWYCTALRRFAAFLLPAELKAQTLQDTAARRLKGQPQDTVSSRLMERFNRPAQEAFVTGRMPRATFGETRMLRDRVRNAQIREAIYLVELYKKYAIPVACVAFILIGVPIALRFPQGGVGLVVLVSMVVFGLYYVGLIAGESLANRLTVPAFWAMWTPDLLAGGIGVWLLWRLRREGTVVARGWWSRLRFWGTTS